MKQLLDYIVPNIVTHPEEVVITENNQDGIVNLTIQTNPEDIGRVIGKSGKVIKAIRQIARIIAIKQGVRVNIDVLDSTGAVKSQEAQSEAAELSANDKQEAPADEELAAPAESASDDASGIDLYPADKD